MQAMNGLADVFRSRARVFGCATVALALFVLVLALASSARAAEPPTKTYLGTGDSLAFGYSQELFNENFPEENAKHFEFDGKCKPQKCRGYVGNYWLKLREKQTTESTWNPRINVGCPAETTDSFIGNGPVAAQLELEIPGVHGGAPCAYKNLLHHPLHHEYQAGQSQLESALEVIAQNNSGGALTQHPVVLISMDIGANDLLAAIAICKAEVKTHPNKWEVFPNPLLACETSSAPIVFAKILTNVSGILHAIREGSRYGDVNYTGKIIFGGFYNPYGAVETPGVELSPGSNFLEAFLNNKAKAVTGAFAACYANPQTDAAGFITGFPTAFNPVFTGGAAIEPERLQAWTNMTNFTYAREAHTRASGEVTEGSKVVKGLGGFTNGLLSATVPPPAAGGLSPEEPIDRTGGEQVTGEKVPAGTTLVRVISSTEIELSNAVEGTGGKTAAEEVSFFSKNGRDIHATHVGYEVLAKNMEEECP